MGGHLRCSQEPRSKEGSDYFDSRSDGLNVDTQGPEAVVQLPLETVVPGCVPGVGWRARPLQSLPSGIFVIAVVGAARLHRDYA